MSHDVLDKDRLHVGQEVQVFGRLPILRGIIRDVQRRMVGHGYMSRTASTYTLELDTGELVELDTTTCGVVCSAERTEWTWCPTCRRRVQVEDQYGDDTGDSRVVVEVYSVTDMSCGHQKSHKVSEHRSPLQQQGGLSRAHVLGREDELVSPW